MTPEEKKHLNAPPTMRWSRHPGSDSITGAKWSLASLEQRLPARHDAVHDDGSFDLGRNRFDVLSVSSPRVKRASSPAGFPRPTHVIYIKGAFAEFERSLIKGTKGEGTALPKQRGALTRGGKDLHPRTRIDPARRQRLSEVGAQEGARPRIDKTVGNVSDVMDERVLDSPRKVSLGPIAFRLTEEAGQQDTATLLGPPHKQCHAGLRIDRHVEHVG